MGGESGACGARESAGVVRGVVCERARDCMGSRCGLALPCGECDVSHTCTFPAWDVLHLVGVSVRTPV